MTRSTALLPGLVDGDRRVEPRGRAARRDVPAVPGRARALPPAAAHARAAADPLRRADARAARRHARRAHRRGRARRAADAAVGPPARVRRCDRRHRGRRRRDRRAADRPLPATVARLARLTRQLRPGPAAPGGILRGRCYPARPGPRARRAVAQLAEHRSPKPAVGGSSPSCPARTRTPTVRCSRRSDAHEAT